MECVAERGWHRSVWLAAQPVAVEDSCAAQRHARVVVGPPGFHALCSMASTFYSAANPLQARWRQAAVPAATAAPAAGAAAAPMRQLHGPMLLHGLMLLPWVPPLLRLLPRSRRRLRRVQWPLPLPRLLLRDRGQQHEK